MSESKPVQPFDAFKSTWPHVIAQVEAALPSIVASNPKLGSMKAILSAMEGIRDGINLLDQIMKSIPVAEPEPAPAPAELKAVPKSE